MRAAFDSTQPTFGQHGWTWSDRVGEPSILNATHALRPRYIYDSEYEIRHDFWLLEYYHTPGLMTRLTRASQAWLPRDMNVGYLYPPGFSFWQDAKVAAEPIRVTWIVFDDAAGRATGRWRKASAEGVIRLQDPDGDLGNALLRIAETGHALGDMGLFKAQSELFVVFDLLMHARQLGVREWCLTRRADAGQHLSIGQRGALYLREHLSERITLRSLARHLHISESHLSHSYQKEMGEAPKQTLMRLRIEAARGLLSSGFKLEHIAEITGFCNAFHLSHAFKKSEGVSPMRFMQRLRPKRLSPRPVD